MEVTRYIAVDIQYSDGKAEQELHMNSGRAGVAIDQERQKKGNETVAYRRVHRRQRTQRMLGRNPK